MKNIVLEAKGLSGTVYRAFSLTQKSIIKDVNEFTNELKIEMIVSAWKKLYYQKVEDEKLEIEPCIAINDFIYCKSCEITTKADDVELEINKNVEEYIMALRKEISYWILCMQ